jgi:hypothetical protein
LAHELATHAIDETRPVAGPVTRSSKPQ